MATARRRRATPNDDLVAAILAAKGRPLGYRPDWFQTLQGWVYFGDAPAGAERIAAMQPPFSASEQLRAWRQAHLEHERAHFRPAKADQQ